MYSIRFRDNKTAATSVASPATSKVLHQNDVAAMGSITDPSAVVKESFFVDDSAQVEEGAPKAGAGFLRKIDRKVAHGDVPSTISGGGSHIKSNSSQETISQKSPDFKSDFSLDDGEMDRETLQEQKAEAKAAREEQRKQRQRERQEHQKQKRREQLNRITKRTEELARQSEEAEEKRVREKVKPNEAKKSLRKSLFDIGKNLRVEKVGLYKITVEETFQDLKHPNDMRFHNLKYIEKVVEHIGSLTQESGAETTNDVSTTKYTIANLVSYVNRFDRDFSSAPVANRAMLNADGTPKVVYHGTNTDFFVFKSNDQAYWFSEYEDYAEAMAFERGGEEIKACYLNMRNPYYAKLAPGEFSDPGFEAPILKYAKDNGYDGIIIECDTTNPIEQETFYVAFDPTQIKSATDNIGTFDGGSPDIRYSVDDSAQEAGAGFLRKDEVEDEARRRGYPVLNNRQVVPFKTWVRAADRGNYGLVVGMGVDDKLIVAFHNKAEDSRGL